MRALPTKSRGAKSRRLFLCTIRVCVKFRLNASQTRWQRQWPKQYPSFYALPVMPLGGPLCRYRYNETYADISKMPIVWREDPRVSAVCQRGDQVSAFYFRPHSVLSVSSSSAYLNTASPLKTDLLPSDSRLNASRFMRTVTRA